MKYVLYGMGISNQAVLHFFRLHQIEYVVIIDDKYGTLDENTILFLLKDTHMIVKSPGIPFDVPILNYAKQLQIEVVSDLELYYRIYPQNEYILVTGSVGKTSTVHLISDMFSQTTQPVLPMGNVGLPIFDFLDEEKHRMKLIEASSFMLHHTYTVVPQVYVITNIFPHHLDYHKSIENYSLDKMKLIQNMKEDGVVVYNLDCDYLREKMEKLENRKVMTFSLTNSKANCYIQNGYIVFNNRPIISIANIVKQEKHDLYNAMAACLVAEYYHIDERAIRYVLETFQGIQYRFETIYNQNQIVIINDAKSTTPIATLAAIEAVEKQYPFYNKILILGGLSKQESYEQLNSKLVQYACVYCFGKSKLELAQSIQAPLIKIMDTIYDVIEDISLLPPLAVVFSPGCVSFDQFRSFEERGKYFNYLIENKIKKRRAQ